MTHLLTDDIKRRGARNQECSIYGISGRWKKLCLDEPKLFAISIQLKRLERIKRILRRISLIRGLRSNQYLNMFFYTTITFELHSATGDYYRFSPQTFKEVFFEGMSNVEIHTIMLPPRIIGVGIKK